MANQPGSMPPHHDPERLARSMAEVAERSQKLVQDFLNNQNVDGAIEHPDPLNVGAAFIEMTQKMISDPSKMMTAQVKLWADFLELWNRQARRMMGETVEPAFAPEKGDKRFKDSEWTENHVFDFIKQSYLLTARWLYSTATGVEGLDKKTAKKVDFYTRQFVDAMAPSNFLMTNPEVLRATVESGGENLVKGLDNLLGDLERGKGKLAIRMTDTEAFEVGRNIATTPGKVVFRNDLMELIQYAPTTDKVYATPLLIVPPWINKFYILDLRPDNSFISWAVGEGHTVFVISWINPDASLAHKSFEDYMLEGPIAALSAIEQATGSKSANIVSYCIGGTLTAATMAYLHAKKEADKVKSVTFFTTLVDFEDSGELSIFVDDEQIKVIEDRMAKTGLLTGREMATTFNLLRSNDLIWSFVINNYLMGKDPFPFDLLYWNSDSTGMPAAMQSFYLHNMYQDNKLKDPGGVELNGVPIDLRLNKTPTYILSTREDHIAPWRATYAATQIYSGPVRFVLTASGHIAGVVNPPAAKKYCHWTNDKLPPTPEEWEAGAKQHEGSWWPDWKKWVSKHTGKKDTKPRIPGDGGLKAIEDAPGSYVKIRI
ncbi:MAG: class I poly(R)-hydroxyalkanoic acid synthase [Rhodospirillales bacterium]|nr:class I poly(R)-hydroxyalkanoic acid synthase [Rhodospirillales bacterium]MCW8953037.1 class I poly(R)-hydroxyalkanoic acid synthase [Rhodospirillales bacterium]MCW8970164.1 class I poly(R)-hydroxyalkanoic acid synthase [Rhodospirillales bacterium]MCW9001818.1 class I poly(R)-hydroxyalkanoic acid synthase [Rhodospirillales bacterium]MCW9040267.1 class I poly(R)-hydroxyalkanoic acid synthase [Rhodospirillales bacterium]